MCGHFPRVPPMKKYFSLFDNWLNRLSFNELHYSMVKGDISQYTELFLESSHNIKTFFKENSLWLLTDTANITVLKRWTKVKATFSLPLTSYFSGVKEMAMHNNIIKDTALISFMISEAYTFRC